MREFFRNPDSFTVVMTLKKLESLVYSIAYAMSGTVILVYFPLIVTRHTYTLSTGRDRVLY
jgi:hypothetical protein